MRERVQRYILESNETKYKVYEQCIDNILEASEILIQAFKDGNKYLNHTTSDIKLPPSSFVSIQNYQGVRRSPPHTLHRGLSFANFPSINTLTD